MDLFPLPGARSALKNTRSSLTVCGALLSGLATAASPLPEEIQYSVIHPDDQISSRWNFRLSFVPVIPTFMF